jgi:uncharacterized protein YjiS (DUF1127 family)
MRLFSVLENDRNQLLLPAFVATGWVQRRRSIIMQNRNDVNTYMAGLMGHNIPQADPQTRQEMGYHARHVAIGSFLAEVAISLVAMIKGWSARRRQYRELNTLSDHMLKDMGFTRDQISQVVNNELRRPEMSLRPTASQSSPAFSEPKENTTDDTDMPLAA